MGLGGLPNKNRVRTLFSTLNPDMILIQETICDHFSALHLFSKLKPGWEFVLLTPMVSLGDFLLGGILTSLTTRLTNPMLVY